MPFTTSIHPHVGVKASVLECSPLLFTLNKHAIDISGTSYNYNEAKELKMQVTFKHHFNDVTLLA